MIIYRQCSLLYTLPTAVCWRPLGSWGPRLKPIQRIGKYGPEINVTQFFMVMEFLGNVFTNLFLKNFSRMKRWWREELQLPVSPVATGGLNRANKASSPPNWNTKHYKSVEILSIFGVSSPPHKPKAPPQKRKPPLLKTFWRRFLLPVTIKCNYL